MEETTYNAVYSSDCSSLNFSPEFYDVNMVCNHAVWIKLQEKKTADILTLSFSVSRANYTNRSSGYHWDDNHSIHHRRGLSVT